MQKVRTSQILDANGKPIKIKEALSEEQTSKLGNISKEFENHPSRGLTPAKLAGILAAAEQGDLVQQADLFEDMEEKDGHISCEMGKRKRALLGLDWKLEPPRNPTAQEKALADEVTEWLEDMPDFEDYLLDMADAIGKCYSMLEISWQQQGNLLFPKLTHQPPRWFTVDKDDRNKLLLRNNTGEGEALWPFKWVQHIHKSKSGYIARGGLGRVLAWPYLFKNFSIRDLAEFCEIYGIPARLGTYPAGASEEEKSTLLRAVIGVGHSAAGIMPEGMMIDFKEAAKGASDPFQFMINWSESVQSKVILGGTLTSTAENTGLGSNLGDIHNEIRKDLLVSDARQIAGTLTRDLIWPMIALNKPGVSQDRAPRFEFITEESESLDQRAERDKKLAEIGIKLKPERIEEIYGEEYQYTQTSDSSQNSQTTVKQNEDQAAAIAAAAAGDSSMELDGLTEQVIKQTQPQIDQLYARIKQLLNEVDSMESLQDRLVEAFSYLEPDALSDVIQMGLATAELAGRYEVAEND